MCMSEAHARDSSLNAIIGPRNNVPDAPGRTVRCTMYSMAQAISILSASFSIRPAISSMVAAIAASISAMRVS